MNRTMMLRAAVAGLVALVVAAGVSIGLLLTNGPGNYTVTARFSGTPGLYTHNAVTILGVRTGTVRSITPGPGHVDVVLSIPDDVKLPAGVKAVLMAPNPVSDRSVELTPPYTGGPALAAGAVIPLARTAVPLEIDQVFASVDNLSKALGPAGANADGSLTQALHALARLADGNGADVHQAITTIAAALPALTAHPGQLKALIDGVDQLTGTLAAHSSTLDSLYGNLAGATQELADERGTLAAAVENLQTGLAQVADFIRRNQKELGSSVRNLSATATAIMSEQDSLIKTFDTAALGFTNFTNALDPDVPCAGRSGNCPALFTRVDFTKDAAAIVKNYCGASIVPSMLPIMAYSAGLGNADAVDTMCSAQIGLLQDQPGAPGAPPSPDLDLSHHLGGR